MHVQCLDVHGCRGQRLTLHIFHHSPFCLETGSSLNLGLADWASQGFFLSFPTGLGMELSSCACTTSSFPHKAISPAPASSFSKEDLFSLVRLQNQANVAAMWAQKRLGAGLANVLLPAVLGVSTCGGLGSAQDSSFCTSTAGLLISIFRGRQATMRVKNGPVCFRSLSFFGNKIVLGNSLEDSEDTSCLWFQKI